jgi:hypothetical protein
MNSPNETPYAAVREEVYEITAMAVQIKIAVIGSVAILVFAILAKYTSF